MPNLRLTAINSADSRTIKAIFSADVTPNITPENVVVTSTVEGVPDPRVISVSAREQGSVVIITRPVTPFVRYKVTFQSSATVRFTDITGTRFLIEDGRNNAADIIGAENPADFTRDILVSQLEENIYNLQRGTFVRTILNALSLIINRFRFDIQQSVSDNYLSVVVTDERKTRGFGPFDRLNEGGAFEVIRVGLNPEDRSIPSVIPFQSFPDDIVTLQRIVVNQETLTAGLGPGTFDKLVLTVRNSPVTIVRSITINYANNTTFDYDIRSLGYRINDTRYDTVFASTLVTLAGNQIQLSEEVLDAPGFQEPGPGDEIVIGYEFKNLGRIIDEDSVTITQNLQQVREAAPAFITQFSLQFAPVVNSSGAIPVSGGVEFLDPYSKTPFLTTSPAFRTEIPFTLSGLPRNPGEYSVDYETGRVFVFGAAENDGTGAFPPAMNYSYRKTFVRDLDYTYNPETYEVVRSPLRDLAGQTAQINFNFEQTLIPGVDFVAGAHTEVLNERVQNRLDNTGALRVLNTPVTNVFRIFNESTTEDYQLRRFNDTTVFFSANTQDPNIFTAERERASFQDVLNETLFISAELINVNGVRVFKIPLVNQNVISSTEDVIGSSYNTSALFSREDIFQQEVYYDAQILSEAANINRLTPGFYQINYRAGIVYVGVLPSTPINVGTISYKRSVVAPRNPHVLAVSDIFYSISVLQGVTKRLDYTSFSDGAIVPSSFDVSDERFLNGDDTTPYIFDNGTIRVTDDIKSVRHVFDVFDLNNNVDPIDFAPNATSNANIITIDPVGIEQRAILVVQPGLTLTVPFVSPGIVLSQALSVVRQSDNVELLDGYQTIVGNTITLGPASGAAVGDIVDVLYTVTLNGASTPVVDYNRGDYFITYDYLADEILVSYEFGDNVIDFRSSDALSEGDEYFVTYRIGALRDSLLSNFGSLVDIPELNNFDTTLPRERYRDALIGALQSFTKGPTIPAINTLVSSITKIVPQIIESAFVVWSLGISHLFLQPFGCPGNPQIAPGRFDAGINIRENGQAVTFPVSSNLRINEGTLEFDVIPEWDGLDNDATLTFKNLTRDGYAVTSSQIFIGSSSFSPNIVNGQFSVNRLDDPSPVGLPPAVFTKTGLFIFYNPDDKVWQVLVKDVPKDGYTGPIWAGTIDTSGQFYDVKFLPNLGEISDVVRSGFKTTEFEFHLDGYDLVSPDGYSIDGYVPGFSFDGIQFMSDDLHYFFDFADAADRNRFSIFKDGRGYLVFEIWDKGNGLGFPRTRRSSRRVCADISDWKAGEQRFIAVTWKINTSEKEDEMHLFIDGFEVANPIRYGGIPPAPSSARFRTVVPENVPGVVTKRAIAGIDLITNQGSPVVRSPSNNFQADGIVVGDIVEIFEQGFGAFTVLSVLGDELTLDVNMPATLSDARFSVNPFSAVVQTEIDIYKNLAVFRVTSSGEEIEIPGQRATIPGYRVERNALNQRVLQVTGNVFPGDRVIIKTLGLNHRRCRERVFIWSDLAILRTALPPPIDLDETAIRSVTLPLVPIGPNNSVVSAGMFTATLLPSTQPSNNTEGRHLTVRVTGGNVDFSTPTTVTINGTSPSGPTETLSFSAPGEQNTAFKWAVVNDIVVETTPIITTKDGVAVEIKEQFSITFPDGNNAYPVIRFSYQTQTGLNLQGDGSDIVSDPLGAFLLGDVGNLLQIISPASVAGIYEIVERIDGTTVRLDAATGSAFTAGTYGIFDISIGNSGFQNGFFFFERAGFTNVPYELPAGFYDFDFAAFLELPFDPISQTAYIGNDFMLNSPAKAVIDEFRILKVLSTDTRVGETLGPGQRSITTDFTRIGPYKKNDNTLVLLDFDEIVVDDDTGETAVLINNNADYIAFAEKEFVQSSESVNSRFGESIVITDKGLNFENQNRLTTNGPDAEGLIEFWVSPRFDTFNDPVERIYFDAAGTAVEDVTSITRATVTIVGTTQDVLSVRLLSDDGTGTNFFIGGSIGPDLRTINLGTPLPFQNTPVRVSYIPNGAQGDRITIKKDTEGFLSFTVIASGAEFELRQPIFWPRDTWHRIRASYKFNRPGATDEIRLFVDGEERNVVMFGGGLLFGQGFIFGQNSSMIGNAGLVDDINFRDVINEFNIGQDFAGFNTAQARFDNFKLSNRAYDPILCSGQPIDVYFNTNPDVIFPSIEDGYTTFLLDFNRMIEDITDFAEIRDPAFGIFNFIINVIDSFDIVKSDAQVETILRTLIDRLRPANSRVTVNIID